jgi:hypothetical protein
MWACFLFLFNFLLIYRKIEKCYFSRWLPILHALLITAGITTTCLLLAKYSVLTTMSILDALVAVEAGLAAVFLIVQGWIDFKRDIKSLAALSKEIDARVKNLVKLPDEVVGSADLKRITDLCNKFVLDTDEALTEGWRDEAGQGELRAQKERIEEISQALKAPASEVRGSLQRLRGAQ